MKKTRSKGENSRTLPVSKKFYDYIVSRIRNSFGCFGESLDGLTASATMAFDAYLTDGRLPDDGVDMAVRLTFSLLKPEIDKAISRSAAARRRSAARKRQSADLIPKSPGPDGCLVEKTDGPNVAESAGAEIDVARLAELLNIPDFDADNFHFDDEPAPEIMLNRRQRRRLERENRRKQRSGRSSLSKR